MWKHENRFALAIALNFLGISAGAMLKVILQVNISWLSMGIVFISTMLLINTESLTRYVIPTKEVLLIMLYSAVTTGMALFSGYSIWDSKIGFIYQAVYFGRLILLWNNKSSKIDTRKISRIMFCFSMAVCMVAFAMILRNFSQTGRLTFLSLLDGGSGRSPVTRSSTGEIGLIAFFSALTFLPEKKMEKTLKAASILISLAVITLSVRRTVMITVLLALVLHARNSGLFAVIKEGKISAKYLKRVLILAAVSLVVGASFYFFVPNVKTIVDSSTATLIGGLKTYLGIDSGDLAASYRRNILVSIPKEIFNSSFWTIFFGKGYVAQWLDIPYLEALYDLGIVGALVFFVIQFIVPVKYLAKKETVPMVRFTQYYVLYRVLQNFANGIPYGIFFSLVLHILLKHITSGNHTETIPPHSVEKIFGYRGEAVRTGYAWLGTQYEPVKNDYALHGSQCDLLKNDPAWMETIKVNTERIGIDIESIRNGYQSVKADTESVRIDIESLMNDIGPVKSGRKSAETGYCFIEFNGEIFKPDVKLAETGQEAIEKDNCIGINSGPVNADTELPESNWETFEADYESMEPHNESALTDLESVDPDSCFIEIDSEPVGINRELVKSVAELIEEATELLVKSRQLMEPGNEPTGAGNEVAESGFHIIDIDGDSQEPEDDSGENKRVEKLLEDLLHAVKGEHVENSSN